ncbi:hypothetical protein [Micromonospora sp. NPDC048063]
MPDPQMLPEIDRLLTIAQPEQSNATSAHPGGRPTSRARSPTARILAG